MVRPEFEDITTSEEFDKWYWLKNELVDICKQSNLPYTGSKQEVRDRILYALDNNGKVKPVEGKKKTSSKFNWARADLSLETIITDNVSFGPNFRKFMKDQIGNQFSCHSDFMDWVKSNIGKNLLDATEHWIALEKRKLDPTFKRKIADNNMYNQYTRDFIANNHGSSIKEARKYWLLKKELLTPKGKVLFHKDDLLLDKD